MTEVNASEVVTKPQRSRKRLYIVVGIIGVLLLACSCIWWPPSLDHRVIDGLGRIAGSHGFARQPDDPAYTYETGDEARLERIWQPSDQSLIAPTSVQDQISKLCDGWKYDFREGFHSWDNGDSLLGWQWVTLRSDGYTTRIEYSECRRNIGYLIRGQFENLRRDPNVIEQ